MRMTCLAAVWMMGMAGIAGAQIVRLQPAAFPGLPGPVRADLTKRGCTIPQAYLDSLPHNVIAGAFIARASKDWAVLCSIKGVSRILVYRDGRTSLVDSLEKNADGAFTQDLGNGRAEYSRRISAVNKAYIEEHAGAYNGPLAPPISHQGIDDGFLDKASTIFYYDGRRWRQLQGAN